MVRLTLTQGALFFSPHRLGDVVQYSYANLIIWVGVRVRVRVRFRVMIMVGGRVRVRYEYIIIAYRHPQTYAQKKNMHPGIRARDA
jgi:hypothetical protein